MIKDALEIMKLFDDIYFSNLIRNDVSTRFMSGWTLNNNIEIKALCLDLINIKSEIDLGTKSIDSFFNDYIELFDFDFEQFLGWTRPVDEIGLLHHLEKLLTKEKDMQNHMYYVIKINKKIAGVLYFYDYKNNYKKANISIGLKPEYRGKKIALEIMKSVLDKFMNIDNPILIRLGCEVETTNNRSISLIEKNLINLGFEKEGLLKNNYGIGIDCFVYSFIIKKSGDNKNVFN